jgi:hypothetical protein
MYGDKLIAKQTNNAHVLADSAFDFECDKIPEYSSKRRLTFSEFTAELEREIPLLLKNNGVPGISITLVH